VKIALISPEFPPDIGGVETYAYEFCRELLRQGHQVTVFTQRHPAGEASLPGLRVVPELSFVEPQDRRLFDAHQADIWHPLNAAYAWIALTGRPTVVSVHGNDFLRCYLPLAPFALEKLPLLWRHADALRRALLPLWLKRGQRRLGQALPHAGRILANSRYTETALLEKYPACQGRTTVAYVGVAERYFSVERRPHPGMPPRLLSVCRLSEPRKNIEPVLRALARLKPRFEFEYRVVGDGGIRSSLECLAASLGLAERVRFLGRVGDAELLDLYADADLFVLAASIIPGSHEGFGIVYLEAAASGVPSLAARLAGAAEAVAEGESGYFVEQPDEEQLSAALERFFSGAVTFQPDACREFARRYTWDKVVAAADVAYAEVLARTSTAPRSSDG
jgi:glycosyltransferase involved in cell wall biosynthesis